MTFLSTILAFFPTLILLLTGSTIVYFIYSHNFICIFAIFFFIYGLPLLVYRLHKKNYRITEGISYLQDQKYIPWWGSHQIQVIYIAIPVLESVLRLIPGVFSMWLRLWGSKIGKNVYWTPGLEIADRGLLEIGNNVVMGHRVGISSHVIKPRKDNLMLYVKKVKIGNDVFIGGGTLIAPGVVIHDGQFIAVNTTLLPNQKVK
ncbi:acyl transferase [Okeanomitos corallinicola TIOX110]|uniref:Acyl transferase n=1 Tax=Okeanomitos corallinicola TIOX110 TaxID=3133117 RepID=A0ABZ2UUU5_9CYAN